MITVIALLAGLLAVLGLIESLAIIYSEFAALPRSNKAVLRAARDYWRKVVANIKSSIQHFSNRL